MTVTNVVLLDQFLDARQRDSDIAEHLDYLFHLVGDIGATNVLELGTRTGESTSAWLAALDVVHGGHLTTVDLLPRPDLLTGSVDWDHYQADDLNPWFIALAAHRPRFDVVFIDTSHEYWRTRAELAVFAPLVSPGGVVVLHDTFLEYADGYADRTRYPVLMAVGEWLLETDLTPRIVRHVANSFGLMTIEPRTYDRGDVE